MNRFFLCIPFSMIYTAGLMAQPPQNPDPPTVQYVSVNPITGEVYIQWINSTSAGLNKYYVTQINYNGNLPYGHTNPSADSILYNPLVTSTSFTYDSVKVKPVLFGMFSLDSAGLRSNFSNFNRSIYLTHTYDSCNSTLTLIWTKYAGWGNQIQKYSVWEIQNQSDAISIYDTISPNDTTCTIYLTGNKSYKYYILAEKVNGTITSTSYRDSIYIRSTGLPAYIQGLSASFSTGSVVDLQFALDPASTQSNYQLLRSSNAGGPFIPVRNYSGVHGNMFTTRDTISATMYYMLEPLTNCNQPVRIPNLVSAMIPSCTLVANVVNLTWPAYQYWYMGVKQYNIYRAIGNGPFTYLESTSGTLPTGYADNISLLIGQHNRDNLCYYIDAVSNTDSSGISYTSHSATVCIDLASDVFIPNAFTPNGDGINDLFMAYFAFDPSQFTMIIYNRSGETVFESNNAQEGWNGKLKGGISAPEGVYIYFITYASGNGRKMNKKGTFSLIYP